MKIPTESVDPILAPLLITLFLMLIIFVVFVFYIGIKKNLIRINDEEGEKLGASKNQMVDEYKGSNKSGKLLICNEITNSCELAEV